MSSSPGLGLNPARVHVSPSLNRDLLFIDRMLGQVVERQHGPQDLALARELYLDTGDPRTLLDRFPQFREPEVVQRILRLFSLLFQLFNTAELKEIIRVNRKREHAPDGKPRAESIRDAVHRLKAAGLSATRVQELLHKIDIG